MHEIVPYMTRPKREKKIKTRAVELIFVCAGYRDERFSAMDVVEQQPMRSVLTSDCDMRRARIPPQTKSRMCASDTTSSMERRDKTPHAPHSGPTALADRCEAICP